MCTYYTDFLVKKVRSGSDLAKTFESDRIRIHNTGYRRLKNQLLGIVTLTVFSPSFECSLLETALHTVSTGTYTSDNQFSYSKILYPTLPNTSAFFNYNNSGSRSTVGNKRMIVVMVPYDSQLIYLENTGTEPCMYKLNLLSYRMKQFFS